jgi:hypothetical protein
MKHLHDVGTGKATLTEEQVQIVCCLLMRAIQLLMWMMDRPMRSPDKHHPKGSPGEKVLATEAGLFLNDLRRVLSENTLLGTPKVGTNWSEGEQT